MLLSWFIISPFIIEAVFKRLPELAQQVRALEKQLAELTKK